MKNKRHWQKAGLKDHNNDNNRDHSHGSSSFSRLKMSETAEAESESKSEEKEVVPLYQAEGLLAVHKPLTWTSNDVVAYIRGILTRDARDRGADENSPSDDSSGNKKKKKKKGGRKQLLKVGHGGTLDPLASGVLVLGIGSGTTKLQSYLEGDKHYVAVVELGYETSTLDCEGEVVKIVDCGHVASMSDNVAGVMSKFQGKIQQVPPLFSAVRVDGKRLYEYAREEKKINDETIKDANSNQEGGDESKESAPTAEDIEIPVREVEVYSIKASSKLEESVIRSGVVDGRKYREVVDSMKAAEAAAAAAVENAANNGEENSATNNTKEETKGNEQGENDRNNKNNKKKNKRNKNNDNKKNIFDEETVPKLQIDKHDNDDVLSLSLPQFSLQVQCGGGTYIRSLVRDIGYELDTVATMTGLVRTKQGPFVLGEDVLRKEDWTADKIYEMVKKNRENGIV